MAGQPNNQPVQRNMTANRDMEYIDLLKPAGKKYMAPVSPWCKPLRKCKDIADPQSSRTLARRCRTRRTGCSIPRRCGRPDGTRFLKCPTISSSLRS